MSKMYAAVTADQYELIIAIADTVTELAQLTGCKLGNILSDISRGSNGKVRGYKFIAINMDEPPDVYAPQRGFDYKSMIVRC